MPGTSDHVSEEDLEQYCLSRLTEVGCSRLEEHLLLCETCRDRLTETENFIAAMRQAGRQGRAKRLAKGAAGLVARATAGPMAIAALLMICAALWFGRHSSAPSPLPFAVELTAPRGTAPGQAPAGHPLLLKLDLTGLDGQPFAGEVVDSSGRRVAHFAIAAPVRLNGLARGSYFVRVYNSDGALLREYGLAVHR